MWEEKMHRENTLKVFIIMTANSNSDWPENLQ